MERISACSSLEEGTPGWGFRTIVPGVEASYVGVDLLPVVKELVERQGLKGAAVGVAAEWLLVSQLLLPFIKGESRVTTRLQNDHRRQGCVIDTHADGSQRGRVLPEVRSWVDGMPGPQRYDGIASVSLWPEGGQGPSTSQIEVEGRSATELLDQLSQHCFQLPLKSALWVEYDREGIPSAARGWVLTCLPGTPKEQIEAFATRLRNADPELRAIKNRTVEEQLTTLAETALALPGPFLPRHNCPCNTEQFVRALSTLGSDDLRALADERDEAEVRCEYCADRFIFAANDLRDLASALETN